MNDSTDTPLKCCTKCNKSLPATTEFFSKAKLGKYGLDARCKNCKKQYDQEHKDEQKANNRKWYLEHKEKWQEYGKRRRQEHSAEYREYLKKYREERKEETKTKRAEYFEKYNREHKNEQRDWHRINRQTPKGKMASCATYHKRRARKLSIGGSYTVNQLQDQLKRQKSCCYYCGCKLGTGKFAFEADHIVPLSRGGSNDIHNIVIACAPCNRSKGDKLLHEWKKSNKLL